LGGWKEEYKIDALIKLIISLADLSLVKKSFVYRIVRPIAMRFPGAGGF
jgi:hypothetical protein